MSLLQSKIRKKTKTKQKEKENEHNSSSLVHPLILNILD